MCTGDLDNLETSEDGPYLDPSFSVDHLSVGGGDTDVSGRMVVLDESESDGETEPSAARVSRSLAASSTSCP